MRHLHKRAVARASRAPRPPSRPISTDVIDRIMYWFDGVPSELFQIMFTSRAFHDACIPDMYERVTLSEENASSVLAGIGLPMEEGIKRRKLVKKRKHTGGENGRAVKMSRNEGSRGLSPRRPLRGSMWNGDSRNVSVTRCDLAAALDIVAMCDDEGADELANGIARSLGLKGKGREAVRGQAEAVKLVKRYTWSCRQERSDPPGFGESAELSLGRLMGWDWLKRKEMKEWVIYSGGPCECEDTEYGYEYSDDCGDSHSDDDEDDDERSDDYDGHDATPRYYYVKQSEQVYHGIL